MSATNKPAIPQKAPCPTEVEAGQVYFWCACGKSKRQPYCDGSHTASGFNPLRVQEPESKTVYLCACKQTSTPPYCDGTHKKL
jgi:CDGSH-type Zn-finger protein